MGQREGGGWRGGGGVRGEGSAERSGEKWRGEERTPPHKSGESASVETRRDAARKGSQTGIEPRVSKVVSLTPVCRSTPRGKNARRTRTSSGHATHCSNIGWHSPSAYCPVTDRAGSAVSVRHIIFPAPRERERARLLARSRSCDASRRRRRKKEEEVETDDDTCAYGAKRGRADRRPIAGHGEADRAREAGKEARRRKTPSDFFYCAARRPPPIFISAALSSPPPLAPRPPRVRARARARVPLRRADTRFAFSHAPPYYAALVDQREVYPRLPAA